MWDQSPVFDGHWHFQGSFEGYWTLADYFWRLKLVPDFLWVAQRWRRVGWEHQHLCNGTKKCLFSTQWRNNNKKVIGDGCCVTGCCAAWPGSTCRTSRAPSTLTPAKSRIRQAALPQGSIILFLIHLTSFFIPTFILFLSFLNFSYVFTFVSVAIFFLAIVHNLPFERPDWTRERRFSTSSTTLFYFYYYYFFFFYNLLMHWGSGVDTAVDFHLFRKHLPSTSFSTAGSSHQLQNAVFKSN